MLSREYVGEWDPQDDPVREHRVLFPHCPFMQDQDVGNVTIAEEAAVALAVPDTEGEPSDHEGDHMATPATGISRAGAASTTASSSAGEDEAGIRPRRRDLDSKGNQSFEFISRYISKLITHLNLV